MLPSQWNYRVLELVVNFSAHQTVYCPTNAPKL